MKFQFGLLLLALLHFACPWRDMNCHVHAQESAVSEKGTQDGSDDSDNAFFSENVEPILIEHCYSCHSHNSEISGNLALDFASGWKMGGDRGPAVIPGKPDESLLLKAVRGEIADLRMPPEEGLSKEQIEILSRWISEGAHDPRVSPPQPPTPSPWWSLEPIVEPAIPTTPAEHPIDAFLATDHSELGLTPGQLADRRTLLRRLMIDLHGLLPTPEQLREFENDASPDAYERLVDRLLASPRYGERWGRHWFDWIHFADTHGYEHDVMRTNAWPYRDYVIESLNHDTPWDEWIRQQLAADVLYADRPELIPALGFLAAGPWDHSTAATAQNTFDYIDRDEMVTQVMSVLTSTTVHCARCHNHKFDPIPQSDYYALQAVFAGVGRGNVAYDADPMIGRKRQAALKLKQAAESRDLGQLNTITMQQAVAKWEAQLGDGMPVWTPLQADTLLTTEGTELETNSEQIIQASGPRPATENCIITATSSVAEITGLRLEVFRDEMLPMAGPGRNDNGNFHLSEIVIEYIPTGQAAPQKISIAQATSDFDQAGWTIAHAIDGNTATAWGIFPEIGKDHTAIFQFASPLKLQATDRIVVHLRQLHGGFHTIGKFRLSVTNRANPQLALIPPAVQTALSVPRDQRSDTEQIELAAYVASQLAASTLNSLPPPAYVYATASRFESLPESGFYAPWTTPKRVFVLNRGDVAKPMHEAQPGALTCLGHAPSRFVGSDNTTGLSTTGPWTSEASRRVALVQWLTHQDNPLFWRSIANRVWQHHFGRGIVDTPNDFGRMGSQPTNPELLDWLAYQLRQQNGSLKYLHKLIVTSNAYRRSSDSLPGNSSIDPDNRMIWRGPTQRLDAESYRDSLLQLAHSLDFKMGGAAVQWFKLGPGIQITPSVDYSNFDWTQPVAHRRTIYRFVYRGIQDPFMEALDFPDLAQLTPTRSTTSSPLQALALWNHDFVLYAAQQLADYFQRIAPDQPIDAAFENLFLRSPSESERIAASEHYRQHGLASLVRIMINSNEFLILQ